MDCNNDGANELNSSWILMIRHAISSQKVCFSAAREFRCDFDLLTQDYLAPGPEVLTPKSQVR